MRRVRVAATSVLGSQVGTAPYHRTMRRITVLLAAVALFAVACAGDDLAETSTSSSAPTVTDAPATTSTTTAPPSTSTTSTTTAATTTTTAATTGTEAPAVACPDLNRSGDDTAEVFDAVVHAWRAPAGTLLWEIPLGDVAPAWAVWSDELILGFPDGELVGIDVATCASWSITVPGGVDDLAVTEHGMILVITGDTIAAYSGAGFGAWRHENPGSVHRFVAANAGIHVFVDQFGDLIGIDTGGTLVFTWGGASDGGAVAVSESFVYRATGAEIAARPVAGGDVTWAKPIAGIDALFAVPGTLLAHDGTDLHAFEPQTGALRWSVPLDGEIAGPAVLDHGEIHLLARHDTIGFDTMWHLDPADGSTVLRGVASAGTEWFSEMDDALVLEVGDDGTATAVDLRHEARWTLDTGANRVDRFTGVEVARGSVIISLTFSAERF